VKRPVCAVFESGVAHARKREREREGEREGAREGGREGGREGVREGERESDAGAGRSRKNTCTHTTHTHHIHTRAVVPFEVGRRIKGKEQSEASHVSCANVDFLGHCFCVVFSFLRICAVDGCSYLCIYTHNH
jgi:hypothetical protein